MGSPSYYADWSPGPENSVSYNPNNQIPQVTDWNFYTPVSQPAQPNAFFDNRRSPADFALANEQRAGYTTGERFEPYPVATDAFWSAPPQPIRYDTFNQLATRLRNKGVSGQAPTSGIYTGTQDFSMQR